MVKRRDADGATGKVNDAALITSIFMLAHVRIVRAPEERPPGRMPNSSLGNLFCTEYDLNSVAAKQTTFIVACGQLYNYQSKLPRVSLCPEAVCQAIKLKGSGQEGRPSAFGGQNSEEIWRILFPPRKHPKRKSPHVPRNHHFERVLSSIVGCGALGEPNGLTGHGRLARYNFASDCHGLDGGARICWTIQGSISNDLWLRTCDRDRRGNCRFWLPSRDYCFGVVSVSMRV